jgi:hypothetical protein
MKPKFKMLASQNESIPFSWLMRKEFPESRKLSTWMNLQLLQLSKTEY